MSFGKNLHLRLGETEKRRHIARLHHGVFLKIVQGRLGLVFLDGQDAGHVHPGENPVGIFSLEHATEPVHVAVHRMRSRLVLTADGVPLVDDEEELLASLFHNAHKGVHQIVTLYLLRVRIGSQNVGQQP